MGRLGLSGDEIPGLVNALNKCLAKYLKDRPHFSLWVDHYLGDEIATFLYKNPTIGKKGGDIVPPSHEWTFPYLVNEVIAGLLPPITRYAIVYLKHGPKMMFSDRVFASEQEAKKYLERFFRANGIARVTHDLRIHEYAIAPISIRPL